MSNKTMTKCDICGKKALYDGRTINGSWAYLCQFCMDYFGIGLGQGKGQKLVQEGGDT